MSERFTINQVDKLRRLVRDVGTRHHDVLVSNTIPVMGSIEDDLYFMDPYFKTGSYVLLDKSLQNDLVPPAYARTLYDNDKPRDDKTDGKRAVESRISRYSRWIGTPLVLSAIPGGITELIAHNLDATFTVSMLGFAGAVITSSVVDSDKKFAIKKQAIARIKDTLRSDGVLLPTKLPPTKDNDPYSFTPSGNHMELPTSFLYEWQETHESHDRLDIDESFLEYPVKSIEILLSLSKSPNELWRTVYGDALALHEQFRLYLDAQGRSALIENRQQHTKVKQSADDEELKSLKECSQEAAKRMRTLTYAILGAGILSIEAQRFDDAREDLAQSFAVTSASKHQEQALALFDATITAAARNLTPDTNESNDIVRDVLRYLKDSMQYFDGTEATYQQLLQGVRNRFPQLQIEA